MISEVPAPMVYSRISRQIRPTSRRRAASGCVFPRRPRGSYLPARGHDSPAACGHVTDSVAQRSTNRRADGRRPVFPYYAGGRGAGAG